MRKGIMSLSLPGMRKGRSKTGNMASAEQTAEKKAAAHEEPKAETKAEKPFVQTINVPKPQTSHAAGRHKGVLGKRSARKTEGKK